jgi:hypothetical protein
MEKHKIITSKVIIDSPTLTNIPTDEIKEMIITDLIYEAIELMKKEKDLIEIKENRDIENLNTTFEMAFVTISLNNYKRLVKAVGDHKVWNENNEIISLKDYL